MPEFHLDVHDAYQDWKRLDAFTQGYIEGLFFTEMEHGTDSESHDPELHSSLPGDLTLADLSPEGLAACVEECRDFQEANAALLDEAYERGYSEHRAGVDYWLTRNGHGAGFWDRTELEEGGLGDKLSDACRYGTVDVYLGDDGRVYL
jgi:hypothetical protein